VKYKYRLTFFHPNPGFFRFDEPSIKFQLDNEIEINVQARDVENLNDATKFHIESGGYFNETSARKEGERLRSSLRIANCMLDLGLSVPIVDTTSARLSDTARSEAQNKFGGIIMDAIVGLSVYPDDGNHFEFVPSGKANVFPSNPYYMLEGTKRLWELNLQYDQKTNDALEILHVAGKERSEKTKFLTTYLALEMLIERKPRSDNAKTVIDCFLGQLSASGLTSGELTSLSSSISNLRKYESFGSAFRDLVKRIENMESIAAMPKLKFVSKCIDARNSIAHKVNLDSNINLAELTKGMRELAMALIWTRNQFPDVSLEIPASSINMEKFESRVL